MALSNIFREPRREITETVVGIALPALYLAGLSMWASSQFASGDRLCRGAGCNSQLFYIVAFDMLVGAIGIIAILFFILIAIGIHALGEVVCDALEDRGIYLRPRQRY